MLTLFANSSGLTTIVVLALTTIVGEVVLSFGDLFFGDEEGDSDSVFALRMTKPIRERGREREIARSSFRGSQTS